MITVIKSSKVARSTFYRSFRCLSNETEKSSHDDEEFRVLNLYNMKNRTSDRETRRPRFKQNFVPRTQSMKTDQEWVWSGPRSFQYASVPLPIHQGYVKPGKAPPSKYANAELMKIPNFLHLTPPTISKQCEALKKFCTPFPTELKTEAEQEKYFPVRVITSDYVHGLPTIRNHLSRIVTVKLKLSLLNFNERERDKFLRLVDDRYDPVTDEVTITTDRCPIRKQNHDYAIYLLTALYHESKTIEEWESSKVEADMEKYIWENNISKKSATEILNYNRKDAEKIEPPKEYAESVETLMNEGENDYNLNLYKNQVTNMLGVRAQ